MSSNYGEHLIQSVRHSMRTGELLKDESLVDRLHEIGKLHATFKRLSNADDPHTAAEAEGLSESLLDEERDQKPEVIDWRVNLVLSNSQTFKCLLPKVQLRMKDTEVELDLDTFHQLRCEVARSLHRLQKYEY